MMDYEKLNHTQKKWVLMVNMFHPEVTDTITFEQIHKFHTEFMLLRVKDNKYKIGLPNWLLRDNRTGKGLYFFPSPGNVVMENDDVEIVDEMEQKYKDYLTKFNLTTV